MKYRTLGDTGLEVSVIGLGTWQFGGEWGKDYTQREVDAIIGTASEHGITLIDTAECYGDHTSERFIGEYLKRHRQDWVLATKFGHRFLANFERESLWKPDEVRLQLEESLRALRTEYVDLYQFHSGPNEAFDTDGLWETLGRFVEEGKVRHLGVSISNTVRDTHQIESARRVGARAVQIVYNRLDRFPETAWFPVCRNDRLGVLARVPLASGYLSGKYRPGDEAKFTANDVRSRHDPEKTAELLRQAEEIRRTEVPEDVPMATWALAWCLRDPVVTCVIPGCKSPEQAASNAAAADLGMVGDGKESGS